MNDLSHDLDINQEINAEIFSLLRNQEPGPLTTAVDYAYEQIWKQLIFANGREEHRLSDVVLAEQFGISRTPVRQALERLVQDGLVRSDPRRGFWSRVFTRQDVNEIYDLREALEVLALRQATPHLNTNELQAQLQHILFIRKHLDITEHKSIFLFFLADLRFHNMFIRLCDNRRLIHMLTTLRGQHSVFQIRDSFFPQRIENALHDHEQILTTLLRNDVNTACTLLSQHITRAKAGVLADLFPA